MLAAAVATMLVAVASAAPQPCPPLQGEVVQSFQVQLNVSNVGSQSLALSWYKAQIPATMYYSNDLRSWRLDEVIGRVPYVNGSIDVQVYATPTAGATLLNGICKPLGAPFGDGMFAWSQYGTCQGTQMINGHNCSCTKLIVPPPKNVNLTLCNTSITTPGGTFIVPVRWNVQNIAAFLPGANATRQNFTYDFNVSSYVTPLPPSPDTFEIPPTCTPDSQPSLCRGGTPGNASVVQVMDMVVAQPEYAVSQYNISNQDTADWLGDAIFTCLDVLSNHTKADQYGVVSLFEVEVDTRWGEYNQCNGYPGVCLGSEHFYVGREASMGVGPLGSQCGANTDTGNWYSLPAAGECTQPHQLVGLDCTWRVLKRVRTVALDCVFQQHGMLKACQAESQNPMTSSSLPVQILKAALTEPVGTGPMTGCPNIPPPSRK